MLPKNLMQVLGPACFSDARGTPRFSQTDFSDCRLIYHMALNFAGETFRIKPFNLKKQILGIKFLRISINFVKIQIDTSYYIGNLRQQNGFVFHMHAK